MRRALWASLAAAALLLTGCSGGEEMAAAEADPTQPFWDAWTDGGEEYQQEMCWALEDFGYDWAVDYGEEEPMDAELWADTLVEACEDFPE